MYIHSCNSINKKRSMSLKESKEGFIGVSGGEKRKWN